MRLIRSGPVPAKIMFIGEKPGYAEMDQGRPMAGMSGHEFDVLLTAAGINRSDVHVTNIAHEPFSDIKGVTEGGFWKIGKAKAEGRDRVRGKFPVNEVLEGMKYTDEMVEEVNPDIIVPCGRIPLWVIMNLDGITKWRGSILEKDGRKVIPTNNPAMIIRQPSLRWIIGQDFRRVANEARKENPRKIDYPDRKYIIRPDIDTTIKTLAELKGKMLTVDIETRGGQIACTGIGWSKNEAICIPFMSIENMTGYWNPEYEVMVIMALRDTLTHPETKCIFHNGQYDVQYFAHQWGYVPRVYGDTMIAQHVVYPGMRKALDFISSIYCDYYRYWKDDSKEWDPRIHSEDQLWIYNCDDCSYTWENFEVLTNIVEHYKLSEQYNFQMSLFYPVLDMMLRGILVDKEYRNELDGLLLRCLAEVSEWFETALGHPLNPDDNSTNGQMRRLFYTDLRIKPIKNKKTGQPTLDKDALKELREKQPILKPLIDKVEEYRSYRVFRSNFVVKELDPDGRMRSTIQIPGTESFRFSSSENPWNRGANMQTIPKGTEKD